MKNNEQIEVNDDVVFSFKDKTIIEIFEHEDVELNNPVDESFDKNENIDVTVCSIDENNYGVQFGDGTISFIPKKFLDIVSIN